MNAPYPTVLAVLAAATVFALTACGASSDGSHTSNTPATATPKTNAHTATAPTTSAPATSAPATSPHTATAPTTTGAPATSDALERPTERKCDEDIVGYLTDFFLDKQTGIKDNIPATVKAKFGATSLNYRAFHQLTTNPTLLAHPGDFTAIAKATYTACNQKP